MRGRNKAKPPIDMVLWKSTGRLYCADANNLRNVVRESGRTDEDIRSRLVAGYPNLQKVLAGGEIDGWAAAHLEWALSPNDAPSFGPSAMSGFGAGKVPKG